MEPLVRSHLRARKIHGEQSGTGTGYSPSLLGFLGNIIQQLLHTHVSLPLRRAIVLTSSMYLHSWPLVRGFITDPAFGWSLSEGDKFKFFNSIDIK